MNLLVDTRNHMTGNIGPKTKNLLALQKAQISVPEFYIISSKDLLERSFDELAREAHKKLQAKSYAVRSSAFIEDNGDNSMAGQFKTVLDVLPGNITQAMQDVASDAKKKLGRLSQFSMIIQAFIEPDLAGVLFTRNPLGGREFVVEWIEGRGEGLVSGGTIPNRKRYYRTQTDIKKPFLKWDALINTALKIEKLFGYPQDIEWAIKDDQIFFLQSRPITALDSGQEEVNCFLDAQLPRGHFYFEKTEVTEVAPTPNEATLAMLRSLYTHDGPVARAYKALGIAYRDTQFLMTIGGQLYVDREKELQTLLPAYSYFFSKIYEPKPIGFHGLLQTLKNQYRLKNIQFDLAALHKNIQERLETPGMSLEEDYELIFTLNLAAEHALQKLKRALPEQVSIASALEMKLNKPAFSVLKPPSNLKGNTLDLVDVSRFVPGTFTEGARDSIRGVSEDLVWGAREAARLREYGRWLAILHLTPKRITTPTNQNIFPYDLPAVLTDKPIEKKLGVIGISAGIVTGVIVHEEELKKGKNGILFTKQLRPDLTQYIGQLHGVVAERGGLLSHFAIIAREQGIPVIVGIDTHNWSSGQEIIMNGSTGKIEES